MAEQKFVVFQVAEELFGISIAKVERILSDQKMTKLPKTHPMVLGVFEIRGETLPAVDLRRRFDFPDRTALGNLIVVNSTKGRCALRVDKVQGIYGFEDEQIDPEPPMLKGKGDDFFEGIAQQKESLIVLLDVENILPKTVQAAVIKMEKQAARAA